MEDPKCPFCDETMKQHPSQMDAFYRLFICNACHAELRQMLVGNLPAETPERPKPEPVESACAQCLDAELHCFSCDDPICNDHIRTFEKYSQVFSPELGAALIENHGNRIYCPLCFKAVFNRVSHDASRPTPKKERFFNLPVILGLFALVMIIILGVQKCDAASDLLAKGTAIGFEDRTR